MNKTILDYEEATSIAPDDYIVMDSPSGGTSKVLASTFGGYKPPEPEPNYLYKWDFTKSLTDEITGVTVSLGGNSIQNENGIFINDSFSYVSLNIGDITTQNQVVIMEFDIGEMIDNNGNYHGRFLMWREETGLILDINKNPKQWDIYAYRWNFSQPAITNSSIFRNSTLKLVLRNLDVEIYVNNIYITKIAVTDYENLVNFRYIGSSSFSFHNVNIKALRIWTKEE